MKKLLLLLPLLAGVSTAQIQLLKGPYLQNPSPTSMVIMWETSQPTASLLFYGTTTPPTTQWWDLRKVKIHEAKLRNLKPDTLYYYRVSGFSGVFKFRTAPATARPFRFCVYGDTRTVPSKHHMVIMSMLADHPEFFIHVGDIVTDGRYYSQWQYQWHDPSQPLIRIVPVVPCLGNHERNSHWYFDFFSLPTKNSGTESWYSWDYAGVRFVGMDSNVNFAPGSNQYNFVFKALAMPGPKFKIVYFHHPTFTSGGSYRSSIVRNLQKYMVPLFEAQGVDVVFMGHEHNYERSVKAGIQHVLTGGGGAPLSGLSAYNNPYAVKKGKFYHHCTVDVAGRILVCRCVKPDGSVFDSFVLDKDPNNNAPSASLHPSGTVKNPVKFVFQWSDPDGWTDLDPSSFRIYLGGPRGTDVTLGIAMFAAAGTPFAKFETPDSKTIRITIQGLYWPSGTYWWATEVRDKTGVPGFAETKVVLP